MSSGKINAFICYGLSFIIYTSILSYAISIRGNSSMYFGFVLLIFYPATILMPSVGALTLQLFNAPLKWVYPFVFAIFGFVIVISILSVRHSEVWMPAIISPFVGTVIGFAIRKIRDKIKRD